MAVQSVPSLIGLSKAPYASFAGKTESVLVIVPDSTIQLHGQVRALSPQTQDAIQLDVQTQTLWIN